MSRRYKSYAAETGISYHYFFEFRRSVNRPEGLGPGADYVFVIMADQGPPFSVRVFMSQRANDAWRSVRGRELDLNEQYAAVKMRLFRAFDELTDLREQSLSLVVNGDNLEELLEPLNLT